MGKKILIVDDEVTLLEVLKTCLESSGYEVATATDGVAGLEHLKKMNPDLIILDYIMPKMDGLSFIEESRRREDSKHIPIILLTAKECQEIQDEEKRFDYLKKPCVYDKLLEKIHKYTT